MDRLVHVLIGAFILGSFFVLSISAYYLLKDRHVDFARKSFTTALVVAAIASIAMLISGDSHARMVARYQPAKLAAMEGMFQIDRRRRSHPYFRHTGQQNPRSCASISRFPGCSAFWSIAIPTNRCPVWTSLNPISRRSRFRFSRSTSWSAWEPISLRSRCMRSGATGEARCFRRRWLLWVFVFSVIGPFVANRARMGRRRSRAAALDCLQPASHQRGCFPEPCRIPGARIDHHVWRDLRLLFAVWIYLLNDKIQKGPEPVSCRGRILKDALDVASRYPGHLDSLTEEKNKEPPIRNQLDQCGRQEPAQHAN